MATKALATTYFISYILNRPILDCAGARIGTLYDCIVEQQGEFLVIESLVVRRRAGHYAIIPAVDIRQREPQLCVSQPAAGYPDTVLPDDVLYLARDILDAQVIDTEGAKVIRVNDIQVNWVDVGFVVSGVDIGLWGLCRRLGMAPLLSWISHRLKVQIPEGLVPWKDVAPVTGRFHDLKLQVAAQNLKGMHPADLAEIISELGHTERQRLLEDMPLEQMADVVEESEPAMQVAILRDLGHEKAADVLDEMDPDEAADLLEELPDRESEHLMDLMEPLGAEVVRELMAYEEGTAGAVMTPRYLGLPGSASVGQALARLRGDLPMREEVLYLYVVEEEILKGIVSLRRLLAGRDDQPLAELAVPVTYRLPPSADQREILELMARYNILAVPIVDDSEKMLGVVTIYDVLDQVPELA
ncbi:MAG: CBS domain-containing protein [Cyanobacteria bacterium REEB65]|nr:CBS domain-containing protein [Cyanobacteria bacterium REEB65]